MLLFVVARVATARAPAGDWLLKMKACWVPFFRVLVLVVNRFLTCTYVEYILNFIWPYGVSKISQIVDSSFYTSLKLRTEFAPENGFRWSR